MSSRLFTSRNAAILLLAALGSASGAAALGAPGMAEEIRSVRATLVDPGSASAMQLRRQLGDALLGDHGAAILGRGDNGVIVRVGERVFKVHDPMNLFAYGNDRNAFRFLAEVQKRWEAAGASPELEVPAVEFFDDRPWVFGMPGRFGESLDSVLRGEAASPETKAKLVAQLEAFNQRLSESLRDGPLLAELGYRLVFLDFRDCVLRGEADGTISESPKSRGSSASSLSFVLRGIAGKHHGTRVEVSIHPEQIVVEAGTRRPYLADPH